MAVLIAATMASGLICFHLGRRAGIKEGIKKAEKFILAFIAFSNEFEVNMKEVKKKIKKVAKELQKLIDGRNQSKSKDNRLTSTINPVHSAVQYCFVDPSLFCPNLSMVDKITSAGYSKEAELPSIFFPA